MKIRNMCFTMLQLALASVFAFGSCKSVGKHNSSLRDISAEKFFWREIHITPPKDTLLSSLAMLNPKTLIGFFYWENAEKTKTELRIHRSVDGGKTFSEKPVAVYPNIYRPLLNLANDGTMSFTIYDRSDAENPKNLVALSTDLGISWRTVAPPHLGSASKEENSSFYRSQVAFSSANYAVGMSFANSRILESRDQGKSWKEITKDFNLPEGQQVERVAPYDEGIYIISSKESDRADSGFQGGFSFTPPKDCFVSLIKDGKVMGAPRPITTKDGIGRCPDLKFVSESTAFASFQDGVYLSNDSGKNFEMVYPFSSFGNPPIDRTAVRQAGSGAGTFVNFRSKDLGIAVGGLGFVQVTRDGGQDWIDTPIETAGSLSAVEFSGNYVLLRADDPFLGQVTYYASTLDAQPPKRTKFAPLPVPKVKTSDGKTQALTDAIPFEEMKSKTNYQRPGDTDYDANADGVVPPASARKHIAGLAVLNALDEIRLTFHQDLPEGQAPLFTKGVKVVPKIITDCLTNKTEHWSDLGLHYYCQFAELRQCFTEQSRAYAEGLQNWLIDWQSQHPDAAPDFLFAVSKGLVQPKSIRQTAYNNCKNDFYFQWLTDDPHRADVFRAVMFAQSLEFNDEEQQAVLNAFYGRMKPAAEGPFDPFNTEDCKKYRPVRAIDPLDGTHCRPDCLANEKPENGRCKVRPETPLRGVGR